MEDTATTANGYMLTKMRSFFLGYAYTLISAFLGDHLLEHRQYVTSNNYGEGGWTGSTLELMTEQNVYGGLAFSSDATYMTLNHRTIDNSQYPLFRYRPDLIRDPTTNYWLRNFANDYEFSMVCTYGNCDKASAD